MKFLIVEDNDQKARTVASFLSSLDSFQPGSSVVFAASLSEAVRVIGGVRFDLIILDLMLPYLKDGPASSGAGVEILRQIRKSSTNRSSAAVGLSAFPEELESSRGEFEASGLLVLAYSASGAWQKALEQIVGDVAARATVRRKLDFLIVVALEEERAGFATTVLKKEADGITAGLNVQFVSLAGGRVLQGAIVRLRQMGLVAATLDTSIALSAFDPTILCMSGICAGISHQAHLGQLIVASPAWEYQAGKWSSNGFEVAPTQIQLRPKTKLMLEKSFSDQAFVNQLEDGLDWNVIRPSTRFGPLLAPAASGSAVITDPARLLHIEIQHRKVAAIDMETFGIYFAVHEYPSNVEHYFSVKCVVDLADGNKDDKLHSYGCAVSARAAVSLIGSLVTDEDRS